MHPRAAHVARTCLHLSRGVAAQVAVSVIAAFCVTAITEAYMKTDVPAPVPAAPTVVLDGTAVVGLLNAAFTSDGVRSHARYPMEFETVLGPTTLKSFALFASSAWPSEPGWNSGEPRPTLAQAMPAIAHTRAASLTLPCHANCRTRSTAEAVVVTPPVRIAAVTESTPTAAPAEKRRATILGVDLPGFVPSGDVIVKTVASVAGSVADFVPRI